MKIQVTISDFIAQQALQYGLLDSHHIEDLLLRELKSYQDKANHKEWQTLINELSGTWQDFPELEELRAELIEYDREFI